MYYKNMNTNGTTQATYNVNELHEELTQVRRHGYALFSGSNSLIAWTLTPETASSVDYVMNTVNPQNGVGDLNIELDELHVTLAQVKRHGYAVMSSSGILLAWGISSRVAHNIPGAHHIVNVQNGAYYTI